MFNNDLINNFISYNRYMDNNVLMIDNKKISNIIFNSELIKHLKNFKEKYYDELTINFYSNINKSINIKINNNFVSIYINNVNKITFNNCNIERILIENCNLINNNNNKLNLDIKNCDNLKNIIFKYSNEKINFTNLKINISNCKLFNLFSFHYFKNEDNNLNQILDIIYNSNLSLNDLYFYFFDCELNDNIKYCNYIKNIILKKVILI